MTDLRRWSAEGATPEERSLIDEARRERATPGARARTLKALGIGAVLTTSTSAVATASTAAVVTKVVLATTVVVGGLSAGGVAVWKYRAAHHPPPVVRSTPPVEAVEPEPSLPVVELEVASETPAPSRAAPKPPRGPKVAASSLSREVAALEVAHSALAKHDVEGALRALDAYHSQFPTGALVAEETVLRVQALLARGSQAEAAELADAFCASHPDSPYAPRIRGLIKDLKRQ